MSAKEYPRVVELLCVLKRRGRMIEFKWSQSNVVIYKENFILEICYFKDLKGIIVATG